MGGKFDVDLEDDEVEWKINQGDEGKVSFVKSVIWLHKRKIKTANDAYKIGVLSGLILADTLLQ